MSGTDERIFDGQLWKRLANRRKEMHCLPTPVEVRICHKGFFENFFGRIICVAREEFGGKAMEVWEEYPMRDDPIRFQVATPRGETLVTYMDDVKYKDTDHGNTIIMGLVLGSAVAFDVFLTFMLFTQAAFGIDPLSPVFLTPLTAAASVVATALFFGKTRYCKRIDLECCDPDHEYSDCHVCVVTHSSVASVAEQLGVLAQCRDLFAQAQENLKNNLSRQWEEKDAYISFLENEQRRIDIDFAGAQARFLSRLLGWNRVHQSAGGAWKQYLGLAVIAGVIAIGAVMAYLYLKG